MTRYEALLDSYLHFYKFEMRKATKAKVKLKKAKNQEEGQTAETSKKD
jgi:hypothetical protein